MTTVYRKTPKGVAEIQTRANRLAPRVRGALIVVDGKRNDEELQALILQQHDAVLRWLADQGFIEPVAAPSAPLPVAEGGPGPARAEVHPSKPSPPEESASPASQSAERSFTTWRQHVVRDLNELLGPEAEALAIKIERARDAEQLRPLLERAAQVLALARGQATATRFVERNGQP